MDFTQIYAILDSSKITAFENAYTEGFKLLLPDVNPDEVKKMVKVSQYPVFFKMYQYEKHDFFEHGMLSKFISNYFKVNGNIKLLSNTYVLRSIYSYVSKANSDEEFEKRRKQILDTCPESERILIIYNEKFWSFALMQDLNSGYIDVNDAVYLMEVSSWLGSTFDDDEPLFKNERLAHAFEIMRRETNSKKDSETPEDERRYNYCRLVNYLFMLSGAMIHYINKEFSEDEFTKDIIDDMNTSFNITKSGLPLNADKVEQLLKLRNEPDVVEIKQNRFGF